MMNAEKRLFTDISNGKRARYDSDSFGVKTSTYLDSVRLEHYLKKGEIRNRLVFHSAYGDHWIKSSVIVDHVTNIDVLRENDIVVVYLVTNVDDNGNEHQFRFYVEIK